MYVLGVSLSLFVRRFQICAYCVPLCVSLSLSLSVSLSLPVHDSKYAQIDGRKQWRITKCT
jgi:hypothetical protein